MYLRKQYAWPGGVKPADWKPGDPVPPVDYLSIGHTGSTSADQVFVRARVQAGISEGWLRIEGDKLILKSFPEELVYTIKRGPGYYCCHCDVALPSAQAAQAHVASEHAGQDSPDANNPSGYKRVTGYECELDAAQHARYRRQPEDIHKPVRFPVKTEAEANG